MTGLEMVFLAALVITYGLLWFSISANAKLEREKAAIGGKYLDLFAKHADLSIAFDRQEEAHDIWRAKALGLQARLDAAERAKQKKDPKTGRWLKKVSP